MKSKGVGGGSEKKGPKKKKKGKKQQRNIKRGKRDNDLILRTGDTGEQQANI